MLLTAIALLVFAPTFACAFASLYRGVVHRWPTRIAWTRFLMAEGCVLVVLAIVPNWVFAAFCLACAAIMLGVGMFCTLVLSITRMQLRIERKKARAKAAGDPAELVPSPNPPSAWLVGQAGEFVDAGFRQAEHGVNGEGWTFLILFREIDSIAAEVITPPQGDRASDGANLRIVELTSVLHGHRGVLCTNSSVPAFIDYWKGEIRQYFPGASVHTLIDEHERAVAALAERGISVEGYPIQRVHEERGWGLRMAAVARASTPGRVVLQSLKADVFRNGPRIPFGRLENDPDLWERLRDLPAPGTTIPT